MLHTPGIVLPPHWIVGDERIYNQLIAWQRINETKREFRFYFYENEYDKHNWSVEPSDSWENLVHTRCVQLRQKYRTLKLFYSAGRDSHHILNSFIKHNIPIDELIVLDQITNEARHWESTQIILPMAERYRVHNPKVKITRVELGEKAFDMYFHNNFTVSETSNSNNHQYFMPCRYDWIAANLTTVDNSGTGYIVGSDKPRFIWKDGNIYTAILDKIIEIFLDKNELIEHFYYAPDLPELHIKQCHQIVNYLEEHYPDADARFISKFMDDPHSQYYDEMCIACGRGPAWNINLTLQNGKNKYMNGKHETLTKIQQYAKDHQWKSYLRWQDSIEYLTTTASEIFKQGDVLNGTVGIWGKEYFIKKFEPKIKLGEINV